MELDGLPREVGARRRKQLYGDEGVLTPSLSTSKKVLHTPSRRKLFHRVEVVDAD